MWFRSFVDFLSADYWKRGRRPRQPTACRLRIEALEARCLPSFLAPVNYPVGANP